MKEAINKKTMRRPKTPALHIEITMNPIGCWVGWFADLSVMVSFQSANGNRYTVFEPLKPGAAKRLTDLLLHPHRIPTDFSDTPNERKRISKLIATRLNSITSRRKEYFKRRGYPIDFRSY
jgi:hypothetical protein